MTTNRERAAVRRAAEMISQQQNHGDDNWDYDITPYRKVDDQWTLQQLAATLERAPADAPVYLDSGESLSMDLSSYRGYYEDLALVEKSWKMNDGDQRLIVEPAKAGTLAAALHNKVGTRIEGYKGGNFMVYPSTVLWVSGWGETNNRVVVDCVPVSAWSSPAMVLVTRYVRWWDDEEE